MASIASGKNNGALTRGVGVIAAWASASALRRAFVVFLIAAALMIPGLGGHAPTDSDEGRFVQATKQMLETGDFVDIRLQDEPRHKKPVGIYWAQAAAASLLGGADAPIWAYRLPSLIGGILAAILTVWAVRPLIGPRAAFISGAMVASLLVLSFEARTAKTDAFLLASIIAAQGALARLWFGVLDDARERGWNVFFFWTALAIGVLIKGPIIFLPVFGVLAWMCVRDRSLAGLGRLGVGWGLPWLLLLAAPWFVAIAIKTDGAFFIESIGKDLLDKAPSGQEKHGVPPGGHLAFFWGAFWPWTALALLAIPYVWNWRRAPETAFLLGWIVPTWIVLEAAATKLPHYTLPTYPAICALVAAAALDGGAKPKGALFWIGALIWAVVSLSLPLALGLGPTLIEGKLILEPIIGAGVALLILLLAWRWLVKGVWLGFIRASIIAAIVLYGTAYHFSFPATSTIWLSPRMVEASAPYRACLGSADKPAALASIGYAKPSLIFLAGTDTKLIKAEGGAAFLTENPQGLVWVEKRRLQRFNDGLKSAGIETQALAQLSGFQYDGGKHRDFTLFARAGAAEAAGCKGTGDR
ncbi:MAG: glycosyltransferase family 39 protein [Neomegalonema sp.]|nr:glycosyltransferase family 39 protein [Neomegalonema sp.]